LLTPEAERLAKELAEKNGKSVDDVVNAALREYAERERICAHRHQVIKDIQDEVAKLPVLDNRTPDEILGYDDWALPHKWARIIRQRSAFGKKTNASRW